MKYLKNKYRHRYQTIKIANEQPYDIKCKHGEIFVYSKEKKILAYCHMGTRRKLSAILKKMPTATIFLEGDDEAIIHFPESDLGKYEDVLQIRKKRKLTQQHKQQLRNRLKQARKVKKSLHKTVVSKKKKRTFSLSGVKTLVKNFFK